VSSSAVIDPTGRYRYSLTRTWGERLRGMPLVEGGLVVWIMLNPSTADAEQDDPTIRKCIGFTKRWGYGGLVVVNLFAWRATDPRELRKIEDPVGRENHAAIAEACDGASLIMAAWGTKGWWLGRHGLMRSDLQHFGIAHHLGLTKEGFPKHPLYVPYETKPERWDYS
jgi:hypothetical protein